VDFQEVARKTSGEARLKLLLYDSNAYMKASLHADYLAIRGRDEEMLKRGQWRAAHPDNITRLDIECTVAAISTIQSWLTLGFLEWVFQERVPVDKYIRAVRTSFSPILKYMWETVKESLSPYLWQPETEQFRISIPNI
jgi:hypothetical protein